MLVLAAGVWAGTINTVVGSGTLITFPVLLGVGLTPVTANVSNSVGLFPGSFVGAWGYRSELGGQRDRVVRLGIAVALGAVGGAALLLTLPAGAFRAIVPVLIGIALVLVLIGPRLAARTRPDQARQPARVTPLLCVVLALTGVYGGYFGAAQGVLMMGIFGLVLIDSLQRQNALKNLLSGVINLVAAAVFVVTGGVDWTAAGLIAAGSVLGGLLGARIGKSLPPAVLRGVIVVVGIAALVKLLA